MAYSNQMTKEQEIKMAKEKVNKAFAKVNADVFSLFDKDALPSFLEFVAKFHYFDVYNLILLYKQRPSATFVAPFTTWERININLWHDETRRILSPARKERGMGILAPYILKKKIADVPNLRTAAISSRVITHFEYHIVFVFDAAQTNGIPAPIMEWDLEKSPIDAEAAFSAIKETAPFHVVFSNDDSFRGNYVFEEANKNSGGVDTLVLNPKHRDDYYTLCSFLIRVFVVNYLEKLDSRFGPDELEKIAECVSFVIASHFGLPTSDYVFFFARTWASGAQRMLEILNAICQVSHMIIDELEVDMIEYKALVGDTEDMYPLDDDIFAFDNLTIFDMFPAEDT